MTTISKTDQIPMAARVVPETPDDVVRAVDEARAAGRRFTVVSTGHGIKPLGDLSDSVVIDTSKLTSVDIDPAHRIATVGGGVTWDGLLAEATRAGLTAPFGTAGSVGLTGYCLGGGVGPMGRFLGLGATAVRAVDLVTPDGIQMRVDAVSDPDLLWALKGGGGGFGVVTALELDLSPMPDMTGGMLVWPIQRAAEVAKTWSEWTRHAPATLTTSLRMVQNEPGQGLAMIMVASPAPAVEVAAQIEELVAMEPVANTVRTTDPAAFVAENGDPADAPPVHYEHTLIDHLPDPAIEAAVEFADPAAGSPLVMSEFRHLGGALARPAARGGALSHLDANFSYFVLAVPEGREFARHAADVLSDFGRGRNYLNFCLESTDRNTAFDPETVSRLAELYLRLDPDSVMQHPHPV
jgi:FAD/FMN-containing dehydrogenase